MESGIHSSVLLRMLFVGVLTLVLLLPQLMIESLITERQQRRDSVTNEVSDKWEKKQTVTGPLIVLPYAQFSRNDEGKVIETTQIAYLLPKKLSIETQLSPEIRYRSIFELVLYSSCISLKGEFSLAYLERLQIPFKNIHWKDATLILGVSDLKGFRDTLEVLWGGKSWNSIQASSIRMSHQSV